MDGIPALDLWNLVIEVFHCNQNQLSKTKDSSAQEDLLHHTTSSMRTKSQTKAPTMYDRSELFHIDNVLSNIKFSQSIAVLYVFEDNEAVIKMTIKGRSPTMRHVSRTHKVLLIGFLKGSIWNPKIQIKHVNTKNQLADILTEGSFSRDEQNHLLCFCSTL